MTKPDTEYKKNPICPYCKHEWKEYHSILFNNDFKCEDEILEECPNCGNTYILDYKVDVTYSTSLLNVKKGPTLSKRIRITWVDFLEILNKNKCEHSSYPYLYFFELPENLYWIDGTSINPYNDPIIWINKNKFPCKNLIDFIKNISICPHRDMETIYPDILNEFKRLGIGRNVNNG